MIRATPYDLAQKLLCLGGEPFDLASYPYLRSIYNTNASRVMLKTGRQVSKSTTLASKLVLNAVLHPGSVQVFYAPLQEQAMVFAQQRLREFISGSPIIREGFFEGPGKIDQVLRRVFSNGNSMITLGYAQRTADRLRGQSVKDGFMSRYTDPKTGMEMEAGGAMICADECLASGTQVTMADRSTRAIEDLRPGDQVLAFDDEGHLCVDTVQDVMYKGERHVFNTEFSNASRLRCTANEKFFTPTGWAYLADLVDLRGAAGAARHPTRGRVLKLPRQAVLTAPAVFNESWDLAEGLCSVEDWDVVSAPPDLARMREPGVWDNLDTGCYGMQSSDGVFLSAVLPWREEGCHVRLAELVGPAWARRMADGRREQRRPAQQYADSYRRFPGGSSSAYQHLVQIEGVSCDVLPVEGQILVRAIRCGVGQGAYPHDTSLCAPVHAVQVSTDRWRDPSSPDQPRAYYPDHSVARLCSAEDRRRVGSYGHREDQYPGAFSLSRSAQGTLSLAPSQVKSVSYVGLEPVWDITTEKHHTFFANGMAVHNCQDIFPDVFSVVEEMALRAKAPKYWYCGTPKSINNPMEERARRSTGHEWAVRCENTGCKKWNMDWTEKNIGDRGVICEHCGAPLNTDINAQWVPARHLDLHERKNAKTTIESYRIPQLIVRPIMSRANKWLDLLEKQRTYSTERFRNEVLGLPHDGGSQPITYAQLAACCDNSRENVLPDPTKRAFSRLVMGVDWAFQAEKSYTFVVIGSWNPFPARFDVHFWKIFKGVESDSDYQIRWIIDAVNKGDIQLAGCDWGAGHVQNIQLSNALGNDRVIQMWHTGMGGAGGNGPRVKWFPNGHRYHLSRTRVLTDTFETVRQQRITFPRETDCRELFEHFMAMSLEFNERTNRQHYVNIEPDDGVHATTYAMLAGEYHQLGNFQGHGATEVQSTGVMADNWNEDPDPGLDSMY